MQEDIRLNLEQKLNKNLNKIYSLVLLIQENLKF